MSADQVNLSGKVQRFASGFDSGSPNGISEMLEDDGGEYVHHSDYAALEAKYTSLLRRVDELETRVAMADVLAQRVACAPVARVERWAGGTWVLQKCDATGIYAPVSGKRVALVLLEGHESGGGGSR